MKAPGDNMGDLLGLLLVVAFFAFLGYLGKKRKPTPKGRPSKTDGKLTGTRSRALTTKDEEAKRVFTNRFTPPKNLEKPLSAGYVRMVDGLGRRYPSIPFKFPSTQEFLSQSLLISNHENLTPRQIIRLFLSTVREHALNSYFKNRPDFSTHAAIPKGVGSKLFWLSEGSHSRTEPGIVPEDWPGRRMVVYRRDARHCRYCGRKLAVNEFHVHHIEERSKTGNHQFDNLVTLCESCHSLMAHHAGLMGYEETTYRYRRDGSRRAVTKVVKAREIEEWTQALLNDTVQSLVTNFKLGTPRKKKTPAGISENTSSESGPKTNTISKKAPE